MLLHDKWYHVTIFNTAIYSETVPFDWKLARVISLHKSGPRNLFNNYRPVSTLCAISKVFEKLLYEQLCDYFVSNNIILLSDRQYLALDSFTPLHQPF